VLPTTVDIPDAGSAASADAAPPAIVVEHLHKTFRLPHRRYSTLKERALHPFSSRTFDELRAVDDVSFDVGHGEFFGIVGRNGSGKSTLLKCLAGIYRADSGTLSLEGRLSPFIELGVGFNPELTARDNVLLNAIMLGLTRKQAKERFEKIIEFAELQEFVDLPLKNYSSGMHVRLAFAVTVEVDADVLLIDEVLAVGDAAFQQKCFEQFEELKRAGRTIVLVTHDMGAIQRFCDRAILIERGRMLKLGDPHDVALAYNELNFGRLVESAEPGQGRYGDRTTAQITSAWVENDAGEPIKELPQGYPCTMCMDIHFDAPMDEPIFGFHVRNEPKHTIFVTTSDWKTDGVGAFAAGETAQVRVRFENWLAIGRYTITPSIAHAGSGAALVDLREDLASMIVHGYHASGGIADPPHEYEVRRT
jgi:ABC-type polysaccharide/polyol phosphate transport system ATPase subunit